VLCVAPIAATNELLVGITGGFLEIVDLDHVRPTEVIDLRPMYGSTAGGSVAGTSASPDCATILLHTTEGRVFAIDRASSSLTPLGSGASISAGFVGNGPEGQARTVCCIYANGGAETIALSTGKPLHRFSFDGPIADASRSADGSTIIVGQLDGVLRCIEIDAATSDLRERWRTQPRALGARAVAIAPDASVIVVAWKDGSITRIDPANGATLAERELWGGSAFELVISPDARTIAASSWSRTVRLIDMDSLAVRDCFGGTHAHVWGIAFSPMEHGFLVASCFLSWPSLARPNPMPTARARGSLLETKPFAPSIRSTDPWSQHTGPCHRCSPARPTTARSTSSTLRRERLARWAWWPA
jgi:hypothetical protein